MGLFENPCFVDIDTQVDFVKSGGALYVEGAERLIPTWKKLTEFGEEHALPMIASADNHPPNDPEFEKFPPHCVQNTPGQRKIPETLCTDHQVIPNDPRETTIDFDNQIILFKQSYDVFTNVHADEVFGTVRCSAFVVYGVTTDYCIRCAVLGL